MRVCDDPTIVVPATIYAFPIHDFDPRTGLRLPPDAKTGAYRIRWDYVGQTIRKLETRRGEHLQDKPWADLVAGEPVVLETGLWTKQQRDEAEVKWIKQLQPRLNYRDNLDNPNRIPLPQQLDHRHARDDDAGLPRWYPPVDTTPTQAPVADPEHMPAELAWRATKVSAVALGRSIRWIYRHVRRWPAPVRMTLLSLTGWAMGVAVSLDVPQRLGLPILASFTTALVTQLVILTVVALGPRRWWRRRR